MICYVFGMFGRKRLPLTLFKGRFTIHYLRTYINLTLIQSNKTALKSISTKLSYKITNKTILRWRHLKNLTPIFDVFKVTTKKQSINRTIINETNTKCFKLNTNLIQQTRSIVELVLSYEILHAAVEGMNVGYSHRQAEHSEEIAIHYYTSNSVYYLTRQKSVNILSPHEALLFKHSSHGLWL